MKIRLFIILYLIGLASFATQMYAQAKDLKNDSHIEKMKPINSEISMLRSDEKFCASTKISLNAYSFDEALRNNLKGGEGEQMSLFDLIDFCAEHNIPGVDLTAYYFPGYPQVPTDEYIYSIKRYAHIRGVEITGTGVRNNFANPDSVARKADVELVKEWIVVASKLGAPVIRVFSGAVPKGYEDNWEEPASWIVGCCKELASFGEGHGVLIGLKNHGDMLKTANQIIKIIENVDSPWCGVILDTGYCTGEDPYSDMEQVIPYTVNWQIKERIFNKNKSEEVDLGRIAKMLKRHKYRGYLSVETLPVPGVVYNPYVIVPDFCEKLNNAVK